MTGIKNRQLRVTGMLLAIALLLALAGAPVATANVQTGPKLPVGDDYILNAAVTIKTQAAADRALQEGAIRGIDVSKYQGNINWTKVANSNVNFAFIRASYGTTNDPNFVTNAQNAHDNGIKVGAYHFATFQNSEQVKTEAQHFINRLKKVEITYPVVLDLEGASHKKIKRSTLTKLAVEFMDLVREAGYTVMLYSYNNFIRAHLDIDALGN